VSVSPRFGIIYCSAVASCQRVFALDREAAGRAHYQEAEIHRLRGECDLAEAAYREASRAGFEPQPIWTSRLLPHPRVLLARACIALGDLQGAQLELDCADEVFERLGAKPDMAVVEAVRALGRGA
jgi:hypothetical protein